MRTVRCVCITAGWCVMRREIREHGLGIFWVFLALGLILMVSGCQKDSHWQIGEIAPEISMFNLKEETVKLSAYRGKVVVLRFWASGCKDCVAGMPAMDRYSQKYRDQGVTVIAVNMGDSREVVEGFVNKMHLGYPVLRDPALIAAKKYHVSSVPTTFFIDRKGTAKMVVPGEVSQQTFDKGVAALL
jgi:cytochrome c biogenesis protein CcmG, thiol:disulfide interchange protein DsbE